MDAASLQAWYRQLQHAAYEDHRALVASLCSSGKLHAAVQSLAVPEPASKQCIVATRAARAALRLCRAVARTQQGSQALVEAGCCLHLVQLLTTLITCLIGKHVNNTNSDAASITSAVVSGGEDSSSDWTSDASSSSSSSSSSGTCSDENGGVSNSGAAAENATLKTGGPEHFNARSWLATPAGHVHAEQPAIKRQKVWTLQQPALSRLSEQLACTFKQLQQNICSGIELLAHLLCGAGAACPAIGQLSHALLQPTEHGHGSATQIVTEDQHTGSAARQCATAVTSSGGLCKQLLQQLQEHVLSGPLVSKPVQGAAAAPAASSPVLQLSGWGDRVQAAAAMILCRLSVEILLVSKKRQVLAGSSGLEQLLQPVALTEFLEEYWEQKPLHLTVGGQHDVYNSSTQLHRGAPNQQQQQQWRRSNEQLATRHEHEFQASGAVDQDATQILPGDNARPAGAAAFQADLVQQLLKATMEPTQQLISRTFHLPAIAAHHCDAVAVLHQWWTRQELQLRHPPRLGQDLRLIRTQCPAASPRTILAAEQCESSVIDMWGTPGVPVTPQECEQAVMQGYTLAVRAVGSRVGVVNELQAAISNVMGVSPGANLYYTPAGAQGLAAHYDDHCVWVVQLQGRKQWLVRAPAGNADALPMAYQHATTTVQPLCRSDPAVQQYTLCPGDVLYLPRGWHHQADTQHLRSESSLHLTFGAEVEPCLTWQAPLHAAIEEAARHLLASHRPAAPEVEAAAASVALTGSTTSREDQEHLLAGQPPAAGVPGSSMPYDISTGTLAADVHTRTACVEQSSCADAVAAAADNSAALLPAHVCAAQLILHASLCRAASKLPELRRLCPLASQSHVVECLLQQSIHRQLSHSGNRPVLDDHMGVLTRSGSDEQECVLGDRAAACVGLLRMAFAEVGLWTPGKPSWQSTTVQDLSELLSADIQEAMRQESAGTGGEQDVSAALPGNRTGSSTEGSSNWLLAYWLDRVHLACSNVTIATATCQLASLHSTGAEPDAADDGMQHCTGHLQACSNGPVAGTLLALQQLLCMPCGSSSSSSGKKGLTEGAAWMHVGWQHAAAHACKLLQARQAVNHALCDWHASLLPR